MVEYADDYLGVFIYFFAQLRNHMCSSDIDKIGYIHKLYHWTKKRRTM
jgi:hypothetical protein